MCSCSCDFILVYCWRPRAICLPLEVAPRCSSRLRCIYPICLLYHYWERLKSRLRTYLALRSNLCPDVDHECSAKYASLLLIENESEAQSIFKTEIGTVSKDIVCIYPSKILPRDILSSLSFPRG